MFPKPHIIFGFIFSLVVFLIFPWIGLIGFLLIFFSSFLIDVDHYFYYIYKRKDLNLRRTYRYFKDKKEFFKNLPVEERKKYSNQFFCFHGFETILISCILGYFISRYFYFIAIGIFFHLVLDLIELILIKRKIFKISILKDYFSSKKGKVF